MPKSILIQDPDVLISLDLAQTVMEAWPDASVILCRDARQVLAILSVGQTPDMAILRQSMRSAQAEGLVSLVQHPRVKVLLTGADDDDAQNILAAGWQAIDMPFSATQIRTALLDACPEPDAGTESDCNGLGLR